jgi:hypothetical protein
MEVGAPSALHLCLQSILERLDESRSSALLQLLEKRVLLFASKDFLQRELLLAARVAQSLLICQWPSVSPQWRSSRLPIGGHLFSPLAAIEIFHRQRVGGVTRAER